MSQSAEQYSGLPEWTECREKDGLDPLGMQNASVGLYQRLLPGIGNVTLRMRYYGLYAWLSWKYAKEVGSTDREDWRRFIRRAEALYALIAQQRGGEAGIAGIRWAGRKLAGASRKVIDFRDDAESTSANRYFAVKWGAFGLAYQAQLYEIGILTGSSEHDISIPSPDFGEPLALAFEKELGGLSKPFFRAFNGGRVTLTQLEEFSHLSASEVPPKGAERLLYEEILFKKRTEGGSIGDLSRRASLLLALKIANQLGRRPTANDVRWTLYAAKDDRNQPFKSGEAELEEQRERWFVYHANDLCHLALETLLKYSLDVLEQHPKGILLPELISICIAQIKTAATSKPTSWNQFLAWIEPERNANSRELENSEWALAQDSRAVRKADKLCTAEVAWAAIHLLALVHRRKLDNLDLFERELRDFKPPFFHSLLTESRFLEQNGEAPYYETISRLLDERIIRRHLWVAMRKLRYQKDYTFLIESDEGLVRLRDKDGPVLTNPRLAPALTFLEDIHLINERGLTARGIQVLERQ